MNISSSEIKAIKALSSKKFRDESGTFVVEGEKMVKEALNSPFEVMKIYRREEIGEEAMSRISSCSSPSPVLAVVRMRTDNGLKVENGLYLALDSIRDPGNLGTIIRLADWFGIKAILASEDSVDLYNPKVVQSTMGAIFRTEFHYGDVSGFCRKVTAAGGNVYGTFLDGENIYHKHIETGTDRPVVIIIGNESNGISADVAQTVSDRLFIPPYPENEQGSESLNAAIATAITVAEFRRRI